MKHLILFVALCVVSAGQTTPNLKLVQPPYLYPRWDIPMNANSAIIDNIFGVGTCGGDGIHALTYNASSKTFGCTTIGPAGSVLLAPVGSQTITGSFPLINLGTGLTGAPLAGFNSNVQGILFSCCTALSGASLGNPGGVLKGNVGIQGIAQGSNANGFFGVAAMSSTTNDGETPTGGGGSSYLTSTVSNSGEPIGLIGSGFGGPAVGTTMAAVIGVDGQVGNIGLGTLTYASPFTAEAVFNTGGGPITSGWGYHSKAQTAGTTNAAFHADDQGAGANNYGILLDGVTHNNLGQGATQANVIGVVDASLYSGTHWTDKVVTAYGSTKCSSGCTIVVPDSIADDGHATTPTVPSNVTLKFTGSATFTGCTVNAKQFTHVLLGKATIQASGSNCALIKQLDNSTEQNAQKFIVDGGTLDCNSQVGCSGIVVGNHTNTVIRNVNISNATDTTSSVSTPTAGLVFQATQFAKVENAKFYNDYVPHKCYNDATNGGCNSNEYDNFNVASGCQVGVIYGYQGTLYTTEANMFINPTIQNCAVSSMAVFGNVNVCGGSGCGATMVVFGGAPEINGTGAASVTIDGFTVKKSSTYISYTNLIYESVAIQEATVSPIIAAENNSNIVLIADTGTAGQTFTTTDAGSKTYLVGPNLSASSVFGNLISGITWNGVSNPSGNQTLAMGSNTSTWNWGAVATSFQQSWDSSGNPKDGILGPTTVVAVQDSPSRRMCGAYQNTGGPTFAEDCWTWHVSESAGTNGNSTLVLAHSGTSGTLTTNFPGGILAAGPITGNRLIAGSSSQTQTDSGNTGIFSRYNAINTVSTGFPAEYAQTDLTAQSAAITATTLYATTATAMYRVCMSADITTAGTSSTLGGAGGYQVLYTSPTDSVVKTTIADAATSSTGNTTGTSVSGCVVVYAKTGTNIQHQFGYTSSGTTMVYELHAKVEQM